MAKQRVDKKAFHSNFVAQSMDIGPGHKGAQRNQKIYNKGKGTSNPHEKDTFLKRTGPQLPLANSKTKPKKKYG